MPPSTCSSSWRRELRSRTLSKGCSNSSNTSINRRSGQTRGRQAECRTRGSERRHCVVRGGGGVAYSYCCQPLTPLPSHMPSRESQISCSPTNRLPWRSRTRTRLLLGSSLPPMVSTQPHDNRPTSQPIRVRGGGASWSFVHFRLSPLCRYRRSARQLKSFQFIGQCQVLMYGSWWIDRQLRLHTYLRAPFFP